MERGTRALIDGLGFAGPVRRAHDDIEVMTLQAIAAALRDADMSPGQIEAIVTESTLCPITTPLERIAVGAGLTGLRRSAQSTPVGAGILAAIGMAVDMVERGEVQSVLTWFATGWGSVEEGPTQYHAKMQAKHVVEDPVGFRGPPLYFAAAAKRYQYVHGLGDEAMERMLFEIVSAARANASLHPVAQVRQPIDHETYRAAQMIAEPLHGMDCSLLSDGAVAMVISRQDRVPRQRVEVGLAAWDYAVDLITDADFYTQSPWLPDLPAAGRAAKSALSKAGLSHCDMDVLGIYDCFSIAVAMQLEATGFCPPGGSPALVRGGGLKHDGTLPTNTHGGLIAHGYLLGINHAAEVVEQLRGTAGARQVIGARHGFVGAGPGRQYTALVMERIEP